MWCCAPDVCEALGEAPGMELPSGFALLFHAFAEAAGMGCVNVRLFNALAEAPHVQRARRLRQLLEALAEAADVSIRDAAQADVRTHEKLPSRSLAASSSREYRRAIS
jgi:hypothetical protein